MGLFGGIGGIIGGGIGATQSTNVDIDVTDILDEFRPQRIFGGLTAGGRSFAFKGNRLVVSPEARRRENRQLRGLVRAGTRTARRTEARTKNIRRQLTRESRKIGGIQQNLRGLRSEVRPGFGRLTEARVRAIDRAREKATGNLREQFGARNVLGSSFAAREEASLAAEFGEREEEARADAIIQEIGVTLGIDQELLNASKARADISSAKLDAIKLATATRFQAIATRLASVQTRIERDFAEAGLAANIQTAMTEIASQIARQQAILDLEAAIAEAEIEAGLKRGRGLAAGIIGGGIDEAIEGAPAFLSLFG